MIKKCKICKIIMCLKEEEEEKRMIILIIRNIIVRLRDFRDPPKNCIQHSKIANVITM